MGEQLTRSDVKRIQAEIDERRLRIRPKLIEALQEARSHGDLSENFEYYAAKREKNQNESRIHYLERMLRFARIIDDRSKADEVGLNNTVTVRFEEDGEEESYRIVTSIRGHSLENLISNESPMGRALLGHKVGDRVEVRTELGSYFVEILRLEKTGESEQDHIRSF